MNQRNPAPPKEPDWRPHQDHSALDPKRQWGITEYLGGKILRVVIMNDLTKAQARLIADTPRKAALCEELADALGTLESWLVCQPIATPEDMYQSIPEMLETVQTVLTKVGRTPQ